MILEIKIKKDENTPLLWAWCSICWFLCPQHSHQRFVFVVLQTARRDSVNMWKVKNSLDLLKFKMWVDLTDCCESDWLWHRKIDLQSVQVSAVVFLQELAGQVQHPAVRCGAQCPSWAAGYPAVRGADGAEGPPAVLWRSHRRRSGLCPLLTEWQQLSGGLPPLSREPGNGPSQYPADEMIRIFKTNM